LPPFGQIGRARGFGRGATGFKIGGQRGDNRRHRDGLGWLAQRMGLRGVGMEGLHGGNR
jgi:hypothetical protein